MRQADPDLEGEEVVRTGSQEEAACNVGGTQAASLSSLRGWEAGSNLSPLRPSLSCLPAHTQAFRPVSPGPGDTPGGLLCSGGKR